MKNKKCGIIQRAFKLYSLLKTSRAQFKNNWENAKSSYEQLQFEFKSAYQRIVSSRRVEIHLSFGSRKEPEEYVNYLTVSHAFLVKDPLIDVILVTLIPFSQEIKEYYWELLETCGVAGARDRAVFYTPVQHAVMPTVSDVAALLYFSHESMREIKGIIGERPSYIIPAHLSDYTIRLSAEMGIPLYIGDIETIQKLYSKSECVRLLEKTGVDIPVTATNIKKPLQFYQTLSSLIKKHLDVHTWILKYENSSNGLGIAYINTLKLKVVNDIRNHERLKLEDGNLLILALQEQIQHIAEYNHSSYYSWNEYLLSFCQANGLIQSCPNTPSTPIGLSLSISPRGTPSLMGSCEYLQLQRNRTVGCISPQHKLHSSTLAQITSQISEVLYSNGVWGFITLQLLSFESESATKYWVIDIETKHNHLTNALPFFEVLTNDYQVGKHSSNKQNTLSSLPEDHDFKPREFIYIWDFYNPFLNSLDLNSFFSLCNIDTIAYNLESRKGTSFLLYNKVSSKHLGVVSISDSSSDCYRHLLAAYKFLVRTLGLPSVPATADSFKTLELLHRIHQLNKPKRH